MRILKIIKAKFKYNPLINVVNKYLRSFKGTTDFEDLMLYISNSGIKNNDTILIHSSLSKLGNVNGGAHTVIAAFINTIGENGNVIMPSYSYLNSMLETVYATDYIFDYNKTPSVVGKITEEFRKCKNVKRSIHPTHSFCAFGKDADFITNGHLLAHTNFGENTPFHRLRELNGKIVGIGIDIGPVTFYHSIEDFYPELFPSVYLKKDYFLKVKIDDKVIEKKIKVHDPDYHKIRIDKTGSVKKWFTKHLKNKGILHEYRIGSSIIWWMNSNELFDELLELRKKNITIYNVPI